MLLSACIIHESELSCSHACAIKNSAIFLHTLILFLFFFCFFVGQCPHPREEFNIANTDITSINSINDFNTGEVIGAQFDYKCASGYILFVSHDKGASFQRSSTPSISYECRLNSGSYQPSIDANGIPRCKNLLKTCMQIHDT